jgi:hypothetical protein
MPDFRWLDAEQELSPAALTVRAQVVDPTDEGRLLWDQFMPRRDVDQTKLASLTTQDVRITTDRREWNARGRYVNLITPPRRELEWIPIEGYFKLEEKEINDLMNEVRGNQQLFREIIGVRLPARTDMLAMANWRRLELDVFEAWTRGRITSMNPQTGVTFTVEYGFDAARYQTAGTAWSAGSVNAYEEFLAWMQEAYEVSGTVPAGAMMRLATRNAIVADAPQPMPGASADLRPTLSQVEQRIVDELGQPFRFFINENTVEVYTNAGISRQSVKVWPEHTIAMVPSDYRIGSTAFAPVVRAYDISSQAPDAGVDLRGITIFHEIANGGRELTVEGQFNPMPDPDESRLFVINVGV